MADGMMSGLLKEIEEIKAKREEAAQYIKWGDRRLRKLGKIIHLLDEEGVGISNGVAAPKRNTYSDEFKAEVADYKRKTKMIDRKVAEKFGIGSTLVSKWVKEGWTLNG
jgi:hypothetical protein